MIFRTGVIDSTWASCQSLRNIPDSFKKIGFIRLRVLERVQVEELNKCTPHDYYGAAEPPVRCGVVLPQLSVFLLPHIAQFCFQQLSVTFSVHSTFYHFEPAVSSLYKTIAIVISYRIFNSIQIVFQTFSKTS